MTTPKLKSLLKMASDIISLYFEKKEVDNSETITLSPYYEEGEKGSEMITITFNSYASIIRFWNQQ